MNHCAVVEHDGLESYLRRSYILGQIDEQHFDALNPGGHVLSLRGYCLDALDEIPAGFMHNHYGIHHMACGGKVERGVSLAEKQEADAALDLMIAEIIEENRES